MKRILLIPSLMAACGAVLLGCANKEAVKEETVREQAKDFDNLLKSRDFKVNKSPYLGARTVPLSEENAPILSTHVTMKSHGTLRDVVAVLSRLVPVTVNMVEDDTPAPRPAAHNNRSKPGQGQSKELGKGETAEPDLEALLAEDPGQFAGLSDLATGRTLSINYEGPLGGLLNQIGAQSGYGWDYDRATNTVTIAGMIMRTFTINAMPGTLSYSSQITNKSKQDTASSSLTSSSKINSTVQHALTDSQTTQTASSNMSIDTWKEILENVRILLSSKGKATGSVSSGTITVHDHPDNIRKVRRYIEKVNSVYSKQVALKVNVYSLTLNDKHEAGLDLSMLFQQGPDVSVVAGALSLASGTSNTASATILKGDLKSSQGILKALKSWGNATELTSGGLVIRNNVPAPLQAIRKVTYVAGSSSETTDYGQNMEVTPGEVSTGFSMTVLPHILDNRRVMLNCDVNLAYLESLDSFTTGSTTVQLPQTSSRAFSQSATMQVGQTLVLAGYQQASQDIKNGLGILNASRSTDFSKNILIITIQLENASPELMARTMDEKE